MTQTETIRPAQTGRNFLNSHARSQRFLLSMAVLSASLSTVLMLVQWLSFALAAEKLIIEEASFESIEFWLLLFVCSVIGRALLTRMQTEFAQKASLNIRRTIRNELLLHWRISNPLRIKQVSAGASAAQWVEEVETMDGYFSRYLPQQMLVVISPLLILGVVAYLNWLCALLLLISAPLIPVFMILIGMGAESLNQKYSTIRQRLAGHFLDRVTHLSTIKILGAEDDVFQEVAAQSDDYLKIVMKTLKLAFLSSTVLEFFTSIAIASLAIYIGFSLYGAITWGPAEELSLFTGLLILILAPEFFQPLRNLSQYYHDRASALGAANNLVLMLNEDKPLDKDTNKNEHSKAHTEEVSPKLGSSPNVSEQSLRQYTLHLNGLRIAYQKQSPMSQEIELKLNTGQTLVITGSSGSGKSTLLNIIAGFIPTVIGELHIFPKEKVPIAYLPQNAWIKNDSIYNNLIALAPAATKKSMFDVLHSLGLASELTLNHDGLNTIIGEHGQGLSGGQMQRIALARLMLNPAPIVLLDEPSASLDLISKQYIIEALKELKTKTILVIATHDPALKSLADIQINLDKIEEGKDAVLV